jgi:hypothetical protein
MNLRSLVTSTLFAAALTLAPTLRSQDGAAAPAPAVPPPDSKPADMSKPAKVFIMLGQSNMVGLARIAGTGKGVSLEQAVKTEKLYPFLVDSTGNWVDRKDVRFVRVMVGKKGGMDLFNNEFLGEALIKGKGTLGVEYGVGHHLGNAVAEPVMLLKSCIGNRSLGWDLLPPGSKSFEVTRTDKKTGKEAVYTYAGYKETPNFWEKGTQAEPAKYGWYAGKQYDDDIANAKAVLSELNKYYPGANGYEVAGFFWWQGEKDCGDEALANRYEENMVHFIKTVRKEFNAPNAKFVLATLGEAKKGVGGNTEKVLEAHLAVDGKSGKYPEFKGNVATVFTNPMARGGSGNGHYGLDSRVYMDVGLAMGEAMVELLKSK